MAEFVHLHVHTQYSLLDGASKVSHLINKAKEYNMPAIAITDHGVMYGVKDFHKQATKAGIKPILGVEAYVARGSRFDKESMGARVRDHLIILAKNYTGYKNLIKLISHAHIDGFYYKPRIDNEILNQYKEGLIISSACLGGIVPKHIRDGNLDLAEKVILEYKDMFGDDYYLELMRHKDGKNGYESDTYLKQEIVNQALKLLAEKTNTKLIVTNDSHFTNREDAQAHDILVCLSTSKDLDDPKRMRYTGQEYLKSPDEMSKLFSDFPEAIANTLEIANKVEFYKLDSEPIMPDFPLPDGFNTENEYLRYITMEGANRKYTEIDDVVQERIDFELETIQKMGFPGYFLIVWDFIRAAREMNVSVGPGRGSAAGSVVAYCLDITQIDPLKYDLLFERFLNPDRISMPDIDIDFDEDGRADVLNYVINKYGKDRVSNVITIGTMAPKMAIRDVARVLKLPLPEADKIAKLIPERPGTSFADAFGEVAELRDIRDNGSPLVKQTLDLAQKLEGAIRQVGVHACATIIGKDDLTEYIPLSTSKDSDMLLSQFDGKYIEDVGLLKMDFLGLKTLSIIKDAVENIKLSKGIELDIDNLNLEDIKTYELFARAETTGLFQFESDGMKKHLKALKPNRFEDLIAMNALYRPGPMEYIPKFIKRKHGKEPIIYDIPMMEEVLKDTYGITVYQEQVMLLSRKMAGFTRGQADSLRKAMGKKIVKMMDELKVLFVKGCQANNLPLDKVEKVWTDWEAFAKYAFNKSHSTCYSYLAFQTAYLKAHYPSEYMAAILSRNFSDIKKISLFMDECRRMNIAVLGPDINESFNRFTVNKKGEVRFGLSAIKGVGDSAVDAIVRERSANGPFSSLWNFVERVDLHIINKKNLEGLVLAGAFDEIAPEINRSQYFEPSGTDASFIEGIIKYGNRAKDLTSGSQQSLFGDVTVDTLLKPMVPLTEDWSRLEKLNKEKALIGIYLSEHPLDDFKYQIKNFCNVQLSEFQELNILKGRDLKVAGIVTSAVEKLTKTGNPYGTVNIEDYSGTYSLTLFSQEYIKFKEYFSVGYLLLLEGKVQPRFGKEGNEIEFKPSRIRLLHEASAQMIQSIDIKIRLDKLTEELINEIEEKALENKGNKILKFIVYDPENEKIWVRMQSRNIKVETSNAFMEYLESNEDIQYKLY